MSRYTIRKVCAEPGCKEYGRFEYDTRAECIAGEKRSRNWLCTRHANPERVLSATELVREYAMTSERGPLNRLYWGNGSGFVFGPGFKAWADDFPEGARLIVTARIELPAATSPNEGGNA